MSEMNEPRSVVITRVFDAPIELVYRTWTEAEHVTKWMKCDAKAKLEVKNWVPVVGGTFESVMELEGVFRACSTGRFLEVDPPRLLSYCTEPDPQLGTPELTVRVELAEVPGGTRVTLTHTGMPGDDLCGIIEAGWTASLGALGELLASYDSSGVN